MRAYPHEMSGGMGQRIMIAMMLIPNPKFSLPTNPPLLLMFRFSDRFCQSLTSL